MFKKLYILLFAAAISLGLSFSSLTPAFASGTAITNSFNAYYGYTRSSYPNGQGSVNLNDYNFNLEGAPLSIPVWGQLNFSKNFASGNKSASIGNENYNNEFYGAKLGYAFSINRSLTIIPNIGYEYVTDKLNGTDDNYGGSGINFNETDHFNQFLLGVKVYYTPNIANVWIEGQAYYQHAEGSKFNEGIGGNNGYPYTNYAGTLSNNSGYNFGVKVGYEAYKTSYADFSPFAGVNYESIGVDDTNIGILGFDLGVKTSF